MMTILEGLVIVAVGIPLGLVAGHVLTKLLDWMDNHE